VVLDDEDGMSFIDEAVEDGDEFFDILEVEAGRGLIQDVEGSQGGFDNEVADEFEPLNLSAGQGVERLAEGEVAEPQFLHEFKRGGKGGYVAEDLGSLFD